MENDLENMPLLPADAPAPEAQSCAPPASEEESSALALPSRQQSAHLALTKQEEQDRLTALEQREAALVRREMQSFARAEMEKRGLPAVLADCLEFADEASATRCAQVLECCFRAQVQQAVEDRLLDAAPKTAPVCSLNELPDEEYYAAVRCIN